MAADIAQLGIEIDTRKLKSGEKDLASFASTADKTSSVVATATKAIATMAAAFATSQIVKAADAYSMMNARVSRFTDSAESATAVMRSLTNYANAAGAEVGSAVAVFTSLSGALQDIGTSQTDILRLTETLNKLGVIGGSSADEVSNALRQFAQSMAGGVVRAEEFNSIIENTPEIARAIGAGMSMSMGQLRTAMLNGQLTSEAVLNSLMSQAETVDAQFAKMPRTVSAAMQTMGNEFGGFVGVLNNSTGATSTLAGGIDALSGALVTAKDHTNEIVTVAEALAAVYASRLVGAMVSSKAALAAFTTTMALLNGASAVATVRTDSLGMSYTTMATRATYGATAVRGLSSAMSMLGGPAGVVMLAVSAIYMWASAAEEARQKAIDYADGVDTATASLRNMTSAQLAASQVKLSQSIDAQSVSVSDLRSEVDDLQSTVNKQIAVSKMLGNATAANTYEMDQLKLKSAELESAESKLSQMRSKSYAITQTLNGNLKDNYVAMQNSNSVTGIASGIQSVFNGVLNTGNQALATRNEYVTRLAAVTTAAGQKALLSIDQQIALEKVQGAERAKLQAQYEADSKGLSATEKQAFIEKSVQLFTLQKSNEDALKATSLAKKASALEDKKTAASQYVDELKMLADTQSSKAQAITKWEDDSLNKLKLYRKQGLIAESDYSFGVEAVQKESLQRQEELIKQQREKAAQAMSSASSGVDVSGGLTSLKSMYDQRLITEQQYNQQSAILKDQWKTKYAEVDNWLVTELATYKQLLDDKTINEQQYNTASNQLQLQWAQKRREVLLAQRTSEQTEMQTWLANLKSNMTSSTGLMTETFNSFTTNISSGLTNAIIQADSFGDAMRNAAASFAQSMIQAIIQVMAQKAVMWALEKSLGAATSSGYATQVAGQAGAGVQLAGINAYASTAAIPIVGPAAAPAAAAAATAATTPFATAAVASAASSITGMAHDGISSVPSEGTWLLNKGERVYTNDSAKQLDQMYRNSQQSSGGNVTVNVSLQETSDTSQQGTTQQSTSDDGSVQINIFVADIRSEGSMAQVLERTYGLTRMGA